MNVIVLSIIAAKVRPQMTVTWEVLQMLDIDQAGDLPAVLHYHEIQRSYGA